MKKEIGLNTIIEVLSRIINFTMTIIISRLLGPAALGVVSAAQAISAYVIMFGDFGTNNEAIRSISKEEGSVKRILRIVFSYRILFSILMLVLSVILYVIGILTQPIIYLFIIVSILTNFLPSFVFLGLRKFKYNGLMNFVNSIVTLVVFIILILTFENVVVFPIALMVGTSSAILFSFIILYKHALLSKKLPKKEEFLPFLKTSMVLGINMVFARIYYDFDIIMLSIMLDSVAVGIYSAAFKIIQILWFLPHMYVTYALPIITKIIKEKIEELGNYISNVLAYLFVLIGFIVLVALSYTEDILNLLFGEEFSGGALTLTILLFSFIVLVVKTVFGNVLVAMREENYLLKLSIFCSVFNVLANLLLIPFIGIIGAAISTLITELILLILEVIKVKGLVKFSFPITTVVKSMLVTGIVIMLLNVIEWHFLFEVVIGLVLYLLFLYIGKESSVRTVVNQFKTGVKK